MQEKTSKDRYETDATVCRNFCSREKMNFVSDNQFNQLFDNNRSIFVGTTFSSKSFLILKILAKIGNTPLITRSAN